MTAPLPEGWSGGWTAETSTLTIDMTGTAAPARYGAERLRVGPVLLDLEFRRRHATVLVRLVHRQGPAVTLCLRLPGPGPGLVEVDGVTLRGNEVRFAFSGQHEVVAYY